VIHGSSLDSGKHFSDNPLRRGLPQIHFPESSSRDWHSGDTGDTPARRWTTGNHLGHGWSTSRTTSSLDIPVRSFSGPGLVEHDWKLNVSGGGKLSGSFAKRGVLDSDASEEENTVIVMRKTSGRLGGSGDVLGSSGVRRDYDDIPPRSRSGPGMFGRDLGIAAMEARKQQSQKPSTLDMVQRFPLPQVKQLPPPSLPPPHHAPLNVSNIVPNDFPFRRYSHDVPGRWSGVHESGDNETENLSLSAQEYGQGMREGMEGDGDESSGMKYKWKYG